MKNKIIRKAAASNGQAAVYIAAVGASKPAIIHVLRYAPQSIGQWENRDQFRELVEKAAAKLGIKPDQRFAHCWRQDYPLP